MPKYIELEALLQDISETVLFSVRGGAELPTPEMRGANKVIDRIKSAKTVDVVEVRHGVWEKTEHGTICSECRSPALFYESGTCFAKSYYKIKSQHCPRCGAKMDGRGEGE